jgi:hypothetical protein
MISLVQLLTEASSAPKAIFLAGSAGSGKTKSPAVKQLIPSSFEVINIDHSYEDLLQKSGLGSSQKDFSPEELSQAAKLMGQAQKTTREKYDKLTKDLKNIVIDGTGGASKPLLKKKAELEALGYDTLMLAVYVSPITSLERNLDPERKRNLLPSIVVRTWRDVNKNLDIYREAFGDNFILINNDPKDAEKEYNPEEIKKRFFDTTKSVGKPKTPEEIAKSAREKEQLNQDIKDLLSVDRSFDTLDQAKQKINQFI